MIHPPPHSFSRSPVEEVFCSLITRPGTVSLSRTIPPPYPGWPYIREEIGNMIDDTGDTSQITGCILRYTDLIPAQYLETITEPVTVLSMLSEKVIRQSSRERGDILVTRTSIPDTTGSVCSIRGDIQNPGWILIFTMQTEALTREPSREQVLNWFDDARAEIHVLFDLIVPEDIVQAFR